jgi:hypothetical protein
MNTTVSRVVGEFGVDYVGSWPGQREADFVLHRHADGCVSIKIRNGYLYQNGAIALIAAIKMMEKDINLYLQKGYSPERNHG